MQPSRLLLNCLITLACINSCKKEDSTNSNCFLNTSTTRVILNKQATIKLLGDKFYIIEQGTIDTQLNPCNLSSDFKIDNLKVTISGEVKATIQNGFAPCCTDDFVITKISQ